MKIRSGFVSNSSSSSFAIYGVYVELDDICERPEVKEGEEDDDDFDAYNELEKICIKAGLDFSSTPNGGNSYIIGLSPSSIKDEETGAEFKARAKEAIEKVTGKKAKPSWEVEGWYDN